MTNELIKSWVESANAPNCAFPLNNLPYGVFNDGSGARCGVAIGDFILDLAQVPLKSANHDLFAQPSWNAFMDAGADIWATFRDEITAVLHEDSPPAPAWLVAQSSAEMLLPFAVTEFTDFFAGRHHATNVGTMFRGPDHALPPNWLHIPIGYNGRASSVVVSGCSVRRPHGQLKGPQDELPRFAPSMRFDFELEIGAIVGKNSAARLSVDEADDALFGYVLLNDWSARDIQAWEYQPLGPFQAKATATTISPWIVTKAALEPFRTSTPERDFELLDHLKDTGPMLYDIDLAVDLITQSGAETRITETNYAEMYYSAAQQLAHHSACGCPMRVGDLLGSGTVSGAEKHQRGSMLELSWGGKDPLLLSDGQTRSFLEDGDSVRLSGRAQAAGYCIGFGECLGTITPA